MYLDMIQNIILWFVIIHDFGTLNDLSMCTFSQEVTKWPNQSDKLCLKDEIFNGDDINISNYVIKYLSLFIRDIQKWGASI